MLEKEVLHVSEIFLNLISSHQYLTNVQYCYRRFGHETIHPTQKLCSDKLGSPQVVTDTKLQNLVTGFFFSLSLLEIKTTFCFGFES